MVELRNDQLVFSFPEVHPDATLRISFQRTLRIPDDGRDYPLPPGLGKFPLRHVDDFASELPTRWLEYGGVMLPMYQSEAMWLHFSSSHMERRRTAYPFAIKIGTGKINAVSGKPWTSGLNRKPQDYVVSPRQPWLDGVCVEKGIIRQFVAMPLGSGFSVEEQVSGEAEHGGVQILVAPMKREIFEQRFPEREIERILCAAASPMAMCIAEPTMGLAAGGRMRQEIYRDPFDPEDWDVANTSRCFVHIANSLVWRSITGSEPPRTPATAKAYTNAGLPWFEYYADGAATLPGSETLADVKSIATLADVLGFDPLPENEPVTPKDVVRLGKRSRFEVREGVF